MEKHIKDMTQAEKQERIAHLSHKFYDVNTTPLTILYEEIEQRTDGKIDGYVTNMIKNLEILESRRYKLEERYSANMAEAMRIYRRKNKYQIDKLNNKKIPYIQKDFDPMRKHVKVSQKEIHERELQELKNAQIAKKNILAEAAKQELEEWEDQLHNMFMNVIRHIYQ